MRMILAFAIAGTLALLPSPAHCSVELHAHLFMNEGMTWFFSGDFFGPLKADSWDDGRSSQANPESVNRSGIQVLVVSLYAHPLFNLSMREAVRRQIALAERFVAENPQWLIARSATEGRAAIRAGKRILILSLEGAAGIIDKEADLKEFVDEKGIRIVTPLHLIDDEFGGVALLEGLSGLASPWSWVRSFFTPRGNDGTRVNPRGLLPRGEWLIRELMARKVWIDFSHSSDEAQRAIERVMESSGGIQPRLYTHTALRKYHGAERGISEEQLTRVKQTRGIVGLMPSEKMLRGTTTGTGPSSGCDQGAKRLAVQFTEVAEVIGPESVALGSDYNGAVSHLKPGCEKTGTSLDEEAGFWNIGQAAELWGSLRQLKAAVPGDLAQSVERFLSAWESSEKYPEADKD